MTVTKDSLKGNARDAVTGVSTVADEARADHVFQGRYLTWPFEDAATAGTAYTETVIFQAVASATTVKKARVALPVTATAHAANGAVITIAKRTGAGGATTIASWSTLTAAQGTLTALIPGEMVLTVANVDMAAGDVLTLAITKPSSGVALTAATSKGNITVLIEEGA